MKKSKILYYLNLAREVATASPDAQTQVGFILVHGRTGAILTTAYNGFIRGARDEALPNTRPAKYKYFVHSEVNLICNAARHGISVEDGIAFGTMSPCISCTRLLFQSGIKTIYFSNEYTDFENNKDMLDLEIKLTKEEFYSRIDLCAKK